MNIYSEMFFNGSITGRLPGQIPHTGGVMVKSDNGITFHRFKYVPPVFDSPLQNHIVRDPVFVVAATVRGLCSCGFTIDQYACTLSRYTKLAGGDIKCPVCEAAISVRPLKPVPIATGEENEDPMFTGKYAEEELGAFVYRSGICVDNISLPTINLVAEDGTVLTYEGSLELKGDLPPIMDVYIDYEDPIAGNTTIMDLMGRGQPYPFRVIRKGDL